MRQPPADLFVNRFDLAQVRAALGVGLDLIVRFDHPLRQPFAQGVAGLLQNRNGQRSFVHGRVEFVCEACSREYVANRDLPGMLQALLKFQINRDRPTCKVFL